jgi:hypothetical protein
MVSGRNLFLMSLALAAVAYGQPVTSSSDGTYSVSRAPDALGYLTGTYQHIGGSRFTQVGDLDLGQLDMESFGARSAAR